MVVYETLENLQEGNEETNPETSDEESNEESDEESDEDSDEDDDDSDDKKSKKKKNKKTELDDVFEDVNWYKTFVIILLRLLFAFFIMKCIGIDPCGDPKKSLWDLKFSFDKLLSMTAIILIPEVWLFWNLVCMRRMYVMAS